MTTRRIPVANVYYLLCYAWRHLAESNLEHLGTLQGFERVHDLLGNVLARGTFKLVRRGIDQGYRELREELSGIRGKLAVCETAKRALLAQGRVACDFEELSRDVLHNRILRSTLGSLGRLPDLHGEVRAEVRKAWLRLDGVSELRLSQRLFGKVQLDRNRHLERFLLAVCRLVHEQLLVDERSGTARFNDFPDEKMAKLFEDFAIEFYRRELPDYEVGRRAIRWDDDGTAADQRSMLPSMEADIVLETRARPAGSARRIVLDTKFYREALDGRHGARKLRSSHLYQLLAYLRNREATTPTGPRHEGILLYPVVDAPLRIDVRLEGFAIRARSVDLSRDWRRVHEDMLAVVAQPPA